MKKALLSLGGVLVAVSAFAAAQRDLTLTVSTEGPDSYADGQPVLAGETYLLVYVKQGASFCGVYTDGTLVDPVNNAVATKAYAANGAKCGFKAVQYAPELYPAGGSWVVVLLDTRKDDGTVGGLVAGQGVSAVAAAAAADSTTLGAAGAAQGGAGTGLAASGQAKIPAGTPRPEIAALEPNGGTVNVRIKNFANGAMYEVQSRASLAGGDWQSAPGAARVQASAGNVVRGKSGADELSASVPKSEGDTVRFFRVVVKGAN